jgi:hypothetical protein
VRPPWSILGRTAWPSFRVTPVTSTLGLMKDRSSLFALLQAAQRTAWAPISLVVVYALGVKATGAQSSLPWIDMPAHFFGGVAITYFFEHALNAASPDLKSTNPAVLALAALGLTAMAAIAWELLEYGSDVWLGTRINLGVTDTLADLTLGVAGGALYFGVRPWLKRHL